MIKLYQIRITREESREINAAANPHAIPKYKAHCDASMLGQYPGRDFYEHVADLDVAGLDEAFQVGNIGPEEKITRHAPMHSVSVGDVLVTEFGRAFVVASFGFNQLTFDQSRAFAF
jgi:hypothetical protein